VIPQSFIQELLGRVDIVDIVERYVPLKKTGANLSACCPFHTEKSPSFTVSPAKQFYHCFGCGAHGTAISFLMEHAGVGFIDAVEELAGSVGLTVPQEDAHRAASARRAEAQPLTELMAQAARFYQQQLKASTEAVDYLKQRGLTGDIARHYGIGYAPPGWQALAEVFSNYAMHELDTCGLVISNDAGRRYDRFRERIMFPILDQRSNVIGFGGRVLGAGEPKYLNSPETPLFEKGRELYGLPQARAAIREAGFVLVVEGYMDVVGLAQAGVQNVVATLGTAATAANVQRLLKTTHRVIFCFDRDAAGDRAAWKAMDVSLEFLTDDKVVEILQMPGSQDPDEFIREHGKDAFLREVQSATRLSEFLIRELTRQANTSSAEGRAQLVHLAKPLLQKVAAPVLRVQLSREIAQRAQISQAEIEAQCNLKPLARTRFGTPGTRTRPRPSTVEFKLLELIAPRPEWAARVPLDLIDGQLPEGAALLAIAELVTHGQLPAGGYGLLLETLRGSAHESIVASLSEGMTSNDNAEAEAAENVLNDAISHLQQSRLGLEIEALTARARHGLTSDERARLTRLLAHKHNKTVS
jgi:DNA primase